MCTHRTVLECIKNYVTETACQLALYETDTGTGKYSGFCKYDQEQRNSTKCEEIVNR